MLPASLIIEPQFVVAISEKVTGMEAGQDELLWREGRLVGVLDGVVEDDVVVDVDEVVV
jgi:hypothetical protein